MSSNNLQALFDGLSAGWQKERAKTQMTLGQLIAALEATPSGDEVENLCELHSYRGYYSDLAFERGEGSRPASDLLAECREAMGRTFEGYKGGDYMMGENTPLWVADYGCCGNRIMALNPDGKFETSPEPDDDL